MTLPRLSIAQTVAASRWHEAGNAVWPLATVDEARYQSAVLSVAGICDLVRMQCALRSELFDLDVENLTMCALEQPDLAETISGVGLAPRVVVEAALAQLLVQLPVDTEDQ